LNPYQLEKSRSQLSFLWCPESALPCPDIT
jgi:hypothetical protein